MLQENLRRGGGFLFRDDKFQTHLNVMLLLFVLYTDVATIQVGH